MLAVGRLVYHICTEYLPSAIEYGFEDLADSMAMDFEDRSSARQFFRYHIVGDAGHYLIAVLLGAICGTLHYAFVRTRKSSAPDPSTEHAQQADSGNSPQ